MSWDLISAEASRLAESSQDELLKIYLQNAVLAHNNFQSALVTILAMPFQSPLPKESLLQLMLSVYQGDANNYDTGQPDLVTMATLDIKVSIVYSIIVCIMVNIIGFY